MRGWGLLKNAKFLQQPVRSSEGKVLSKLRGFARKFFSRTKELNHFCLFSKRWFFFHVFFPVNKSFSAFFPGLAWKPMTHYCWYTFFEVSRVSFWTRSRCKFSNANLSWPAFLSEVALPSFNHIYILNLMVRGGYPQNKKWTSEDFQPSAKQFFFSTFTLLMTKDIVAVLFANFVSFWSPSLCALEDTRSSAAAELY